MGKIHPILCVFILLGAHTHAHRSLNDVQADILKTVHTGLDAGTPTDVLKILRTTAGQKIGSLFLEGVQIGVHEKGIDFFSSPDIYEFWLKLRAKINPRLEAQIQDYIDFLSNFDPSIMPIIWSQLFKEDELGNSLAKLPLGQLLELLQPNAARYGIDLKAFVNSIFGIGQNNIRDLLLDAARGVRWTDVLLNITNNLTNNNGLKVNSLGGVSWSEILLNITNNLTNKNNSLNINSLTNLIDKNTVDVLRNLVEKNQILGSLNWTNIFSILVNWTAPSGSPGGVEKEGDTGVSPQKATTPGNTGLPKKNGNNKKLLHLFRPFLTSILRENNIDLDADAVLEVLGPLFGGLGGQSDDKAGGTKPGDIFGALMPLLASLQGPKTDSKNTGSPLLNAEFLSQILPLFGGLGGQSDEKAGGTKPGDIFGALMPLLASLQGPKTDSKNSPDSKNTGSPLLNAEFLSQILPLFVGKNDKKTGGGKPDNLFGALMPLLASLQAPKSGKASQTNPMLQLASQLLTQNDLNIGSILGNILGAGSEARGKKGPKNSEKKASSPAEKKLNEKIGENAGKRLKANEKIGENAEKRLKANEIFGETTNNFGIRNSPNIYSIILPAVQKMNTQKNCNGLLKSGVRFSKHIFQDYQKSIELFLKNVRNGGDNLLVGVLGDISSHDGVFELLWNVYESLYEEEYRKLFVDTVAGKMDEFLTLLNTANLVQQATKYIQDLAGGFGIRGLTLDNFPDKIGPLVGSMGKLYKLPFNPSELLVPLKLYIKSIQNAVMDLQKNPANIKESLNCFITAIVRGRIIGRDRKIHCLRERICEERSEICRDNAATLCAPYADAGLRLASLVSASDVWTGNMDCEILSEILLQLKEINCQESLLREECQLGFVNEDVDDDDDDDYFANYHMEL